MFSFPLIFFILMSPGHSASKVTRSNSAGNSGCSDDSEEDAELLMGVSAEAASGGGLGDDDSGENTLENYQSELEGVVAWLLDAEERFGAADAIGGDVLVVKDQFHFHEDFMMQLTDHQNHVGNVLQEGQ